jgi:hypothetical protein
MAKRFDMYFRQLLTEAELDAAFDGLEAADLSIMVDTGVQGVLSGGVVSEKSGTPNLTVDITGPCVIVDQTGRRVSWSALQNLNVAVDDSAVSTAVAGGGNEKWVSVFAKFARSLSDPRVDGNSNTVYFQRDESFTLSVVQGAEAAIGVATRPALLGDGILLADINLVNAQTQVLNADIDVTRRQDYLRLGDPLVDTFYLERGKVKDALDDIIGFLNTLSASVPTLATAITYGGGATWADGTTNPSATVEVVLDSIFTGLSATTGSSGGDKIGVEANTGVASTLLAASTLQARLVALQNAANIDVAARTAWLGGRANAAATAYAAIDKIITDLALTTASDDGAERIGAQASGNLAAGSVRSQLDELDAEKGGLALANNWAGIQTFSAKVAASGGAGTGYVSNQTAYVDADSTVQPSGFHVYYQNAVLTATRVLALSLSGAENGTIVIVNKRLSGAQSLEVRNATTGGTLLATLTTLNAWALFIYRGGAWVALMSG